MQCVNLILQRLEGVVALFFGTGAGIAFGIRDLPLFGDFAMLFEAFADERRQYFVDAVDGGAAVNMAGDWAMICAVTAVAVEIDFGGSISALPILKPWVSMPFRSISMQLNIGKKGE